MGSRLGALTTRRPKCLLPLGVETILSRQLRLLSEVGVSDVVVVVGYRAADVAASLKEHRGITLVRNDAYRGNGSISSLAAAKDHLKNDVLIINSDIAYERQMIELLLTSEADALLAVSRTRAQSQDVHVRLHNKRVTDIGRHVKATESMASFCGASLVRNARLTQFAHAVKHAAASSLGTGWSLVFGHMATDGVEIAAAEYEGPWWNINSVHDYSAAQRWARKYTHERRSA